jgi:hypothetical protein
LQKEQGAYISPPEQMISAVPNRPPLAVFRNKRFATDLNFLTAAQRNAAGLTSFRMLTRDHGKVQIMKNVRLSHALSTAGLLVGLVIATPASAQQTAEQACTPDVMRLCQQFVPDHGRIGACLKRNSRQLSPACRSVVSGPKKKQRHASR